MTPRYFSTFSNKRGRPKEIAAVPSQASFRTSTEYIDYLYHRGDITLEQHLAAIYYRTLYYQVHAPLGTPSLTRTTITSLSTRFKPYCAFFTPEEKEDWYTEKANTWKHLRDNLKNAGLINLDLIDDLLVYKSTNELHFKAGLTCQQLSMLESALLQMADFFGLG